MDGLKRYGSILTDRFGAIDNTKLFLGSREGLRKEDVDRQFQAAALALDDGTCLPSEDFAEPGLNDEPISELIDPMGKR